MSEMRCVQRDCGWVGDLEDCGWEELEEGHIIQTIATCPECGCEARAIEDDVDPCHGPDDRWCPTCGLGGKRP